MNYAQDALFWRLTDPTVRDLASLLTAPSLWQSHQELPISILLGEQGFRYLLELNDHPQKLPKHLASSRLGTYAENLLAFWLDNAPHSQLIAREINIVSNTNEQRQKQSNTTTLGSLDFIAMLSGCLYHLELTCKYYGAAKGQPEKMQGLNPQDTLLRKQQKLQQQIQLSQHPAAQHLLQRHLSTHYPLHNLKRATLIRGIGFTHSGSLPEHDCYPSNAWSGLLLSNAQQWQQFSEDSRFYVFSRQEYLAPARVQWNKTINKSQAMQYSGCLMAHVLPRHDHFWHEQQRLMLNISE